MDKVKQDVNTMLNNILEFCHKEQKTLKDISERYGLKQSQLAHWLRYLVNGGLATRARTGGKEVYYKSLVSSYNFYYEREGVWARYNEFQLKNNKDADRVYSVRQLQEFGKILPCGKLNPYHAQSRQLHADRQKMFRRQGAVSSGVDSMI